MKTRRDAGQARLFADEIPSLSGPIPSLIKWTGSKRLLAPRIRNMFPTYSRYFEPFVGGGSLLYLAAVPGSVAGDVYAPLVELWCLLKDSPDVVCADYREQSKRVNEELDTLDLTALPEGQPLPRYFYEVRDRFNRTQNPLDLNFIMRTCVNGIVRFNDKGEFNNSFHLSRRGMEPARFERHVNAWRPVLSQVEFCCQDYATTLARAEPGDFVYLDPPYANSKNRYSLDLDLGRLFSELESLNTRGVRWALSLDGRRGERNMLQDVPQSIYKRHELLPGGNSALTRVLNGPLERVEESLYLNY